MTDPRAALAEAVMNVETSQYPGAAEYGAGLAEYLAERGVRLVTVEQATAALISVSEHIDFPAKWGVDDFAWIARQWFAALSGEVTRDAGMLAEEAHND